MNGVLIYLIIKLGFQINMVTIIMTNRTTGETNYTMGETRESVKAYFDKWYARNWRINVVIEGNPIEL